MTKICNVNSFAEAMFYYVRRANNERVEKRHSELVKKYPEHKEQLEKILSPVVELEKLLDANLTVDEQIVSKYFKKIESISRPSRLGFCLAFLMTYYPVMQHIGCPADTICSYLRECSTEECMHSFCLGLANKCDLIYTDENTSEAVLKRLESLQLPADDKWQILAAAFAYSQHLEELLSLIIPAAKLIEKAVNSAFKAIWENFSNRYSGYDAQTIFNLNGELKVAEFNKVRTAPLIFGFDYMYTDVKTETDDDLTEAKGEAAAVSDCVIFLGIAHHIISLPPENNTPALCEKIKALSDETRLDILFYLCTHKAYGQELCAEFKLGHSAVSYHVTKLLTAGFVTAELSCGKTYYEADKEGIRRMLDAFAEKIK